MIKPMQLGRLVTSFQQGYLYEPMSKYANICYLLKMWESPHVTFLYISYLLLIKYVSIEVLLKYYD